MDALKDRMIEYRATKNLSQKACAEKCGISLQTWYSIENGHQTPSKLTEAKIRILITDGFNQERGTV